LLLVLAGCSAKTTAGDGASVEHVVMISIDGLVPDYYTAPEWLGAELPHLRRLAADGAYADGVEGVYPSVTYPAHTTLVTGVRPARHGIVQNELFEAPTDAKTRGWYWFADAIQTGTLWTAAEDAGLVTAAVGWPVTAGARIDHNVPEIWDPSGATRPGERVRKESTPGAFEEAFGSAGNDGLGPDETRVRLAASILARHRPNLMLIHFVELDIAHHRFGPRTPEALREAEKQDENIGRILEAARDAGILERTAFLIVSDHGFAATRRTFEPNVLLARAGLISLDAQGAPLDWKAASWSAGGSCAIVLRDPRDTATAAKVEALFQQVLQRAGGPLRQILDRPALDRIGAIPRAALMLEAAPGFELEQALSGPEIHESAADHRGTHGYLPTDPAMRSALIAHGAGVRRGARRDLVRMIDIAPTAAALLELELPQAEGTPLADFLRYAARGVKTAGR
jgi:predicted AlkP superfamily pyrophosphatase or phosphodiesterase